uniref:DUF3265 domain-containing protein n=1 Tax=Elaeophora elaphi TaxID=1147741 RepID=A0A0R3RH32_9BILA
MVYQTFTRKVVLCEKVSLCKFSVHTNGNFILCVT